jgi:hypothetical protein
VTDLLGAALLAGSLAGGYWLWIRPLGARAGLHTKGALFLVVLTLAGAFWGAVPWWLDVEDSFSWELPPLASRMLGAAAIAFVVSGVFTLTRPSADKVRLQLVMVATYLIPLVVAILALHLDYFDFDKPIVWGFFVIAGGMSVASLYFLLGGAILLPDERPGGSSRSNVIVNAWLGAVAAVMLAWGLALFATDDGGSADIWVWPGDPLASRLIGAMLLTVAATAAWAVVYPRASAMSLAVIATYGIAGALANQWQAWLDKPVKEGYVVVLGVIGAVSLVLLIATSLSNRAPKEATTATGV